MPEHLFNFSSAEVSWLRSGLLSLRRERTQALHSESLSALELQAVQQNGACIDDLYMKLLQAEKYSPDTIATAIREALGEYDDTAPGIIFEVRS